MIERLIVAAALIVAFALALSAARSMMRRRDRRIIDRLRAESAAADRDAAATASHATAPRIVYFTTRTCVVCRAQQEPALHRLRDHVPGLVLERHDAVDEPTLAGEYGILSVPTTAVYDRSGALVTINRGFAPAAVLLAQIEGREPSMEGGYAIGAEPLAE